MSLEKIFKLSVFVNLIDKMTGPSAKMNSGLGETMSKLDQLEKKFGNMNKAGIGMAGVGAAITGAVMSPVKATFETSKALGELSSLGIKDLKALNFAAKDFSNQWAGNTKAEFISAAYDIKSGIASLTDEGVAEFTSLAGITAKGTKSTIAEMTDLFATGYNVYKDFYSNLSDLEFGEIFSAGISKSVQVFKTDGSKMAQSISTLGASATSAQVPLEEQLSVLGMLQATMGGAEAGTKYKAFLKSAANAGEQIGVSFLDANNQLVSMPEILGKLKGKFGETMDAAEKMELQKAFGTEEAVAVIDLLYGKTGDLTSNIDTMYDAMGQGIGVATEMADKINSTDPDKIQVLKQNFNSLQEDIGTLLLPVLDKFVSGGQKVVSSITGWVEKNQRLASSIAIAAAAFGVILIGMGIGMVITSSLGVVIINLIKTVTGIKRAFGLAKTAILNIGPAALKIGNALKIMGVGGLSAAKSLGKGMLAMGRQAIMTAATALPPLIASVWAFTAALLANPITWIVLAVAALVAGIIALYMNWNQVTAFMSSAWTGFCNGISAGVGFIKNGFSGIVNFITGKLGWFRTAGAKIISTLTAGIKSMAMAPVNAIKGIFSKVRNLLPFSDAKEGPLSELTLSGRKVIQTMTVGMDQVRNEPAKAATRAFTGINTAGKRDIKKISVDKKEKESGSESKESGGKKYYIKNININIDIRKLKELGLINAITEQLKDLDNSSDDPDSDATFELELA